MNQVITSDNYNDYQFGNKHERESGEILCLIQRKLLCIDGHRDFKGLNYATSIIEVSVDNDILLYTVPYGGKLSR